MRCPAPPSSAQTHACPRASKYLFHNPSPSHASCRHAATAGNFEMRSRRRCRRTASTFPIGDEVRAAARPIYRPRGGGGAGWDPPGATQASRRAVECFTEGVKEPRAARQLFWKGFRRPGGGGFRAGGGLQRDALGSEGAMPAPRHRDGRCLVQASCFGNSPRWKVW